MGNTNPRLEPAGRTDADTRNRLWKGDIHQPREVPWHRRRRRGVLNTDQNLFERILSAHPSIREVALAPRDDAQWGQVPVAVVVWRQGRPPDDALLAWCRSRLAGFKIPRAFISAAALPRNANGKVDRAALRALIA